MSGPYRACRVQAVSQRVGRCALGHQSASYRVAGGRRVVARDLDAKMRAVKGCTAAKRVEEYGVESASVLLMCCQRPIGESRRGCSWLESAGAIDIKCGGRGCARRRKKERARAMTFASGIALQNQGTLQRLTASVLMR